MEAGLNLNKKKCGILCNDPSVSLAPLPEELQAKEKLVKAAKGKKQGEAGYLSAADKKKIDGEIITWRRSNPKEVKNVPYVARYKYLGVNLHSTIEKTYEQAKQIVRASVRTYAKVFHGSKEKINVETMLYKAYSESVYFYHMIPIISIAEFIS